MSRKPTEKQTTAIAQAIRSRIMETSPTPAVGVRALANTGGIYQTLYSLDCAMQRDLIAAAPRAAAQARSDAKLGAAVAYLQRYGRARGGAWTAVIVPLPPPQRGRFQYDTACFPTLSALKREVAAFCAFKGLRVRYEHERSQRGGAQRYAWEQPGNMVNGYTLKPHDGGYRVVVRFSPATVVDTPHGESAYRLFCYDTATHPTCEAAVAEAYAFAAWKGLVIMMAAR